MASGAPKKPDWIVIVPDAASTTLEKRMGFRDAHISNLGPIIESGFLKMGGAVLSHHPKNGEAPPMKGSALIVQADSEEEIRDILAKDVYATSGVWDLDNHKALDVMPCWRSHTFHQDLRSADAKEEKVGLLIVTSHI
ncbi:YCII-related domain containing protein [Coccidioides posadasii C735 delta SOWgp]|uniref:YCII-related domain containing protein n=1 Tax=Coccidioides posadasii (strain C735) TaxID=222929 RepID=C5P8R2_COCP7|nr:YCII-related domain containing protein [Coccidioides posadasii C735 delta SOWgp]EER26124.1 YCII-related domain containing protein [Coccidioides posadasii C735 delta SOWgp]|eukprot:XP_003068269.1 YCII-related domain containing protein [Coccidioides posadasii C735 delta SOWgp]